jgi:predicted acylesterase/phospholipase RssA
MIELYKKTISAEGEQMKRSVTRRLEREYMRHQATGEPFIYDILVISGGGAKGAFGAGFLQGWGTVPPGPYARPEFDMVTGVSTGSLISPFAFIGTDDAYTSVVDFYAHPEPNWVKKRGMIKFLPHHVSMFNNCHLQDTIRGAIDQSMVEALADASAEDRLLLIGTTNLDVAAGRVFDMSREARNAMQSGTIDRLHSILLASSALPGVFPPIEIDGMLYADGGATSNLFIGAFPGHDGPITRFLLKHPQAPMPKVRVWVLVNQKLRPEHAVTQPRWLSVAGRALDTLTASGQLFALALIKDMVHEARVERGINAELHFVSIPSDAPRATTKEMFDREYMLQLEDLGRKMGADPSRWQAEIPSAYTVEGTWADPD